MYAPGAKKFYDQVNVQSADDGFTIMLDGRPIKTPAGSALKISSQPLAQKLVEEWAGQTETINPDTMLMTALCCTMIDRVVPKKSEVVSQLLQFAETDMLCYRAEEPQEFALRQHEAWQPLIDWAADTYGAPLQVTKGIIPIPQPQTSLDSLASAVEGLCDWELTALSITTPIAGSLIVGLSLVKNRIDTEQAISIIQLDEDYQNEQWGTVEEAQQRRQNTRREIEAAALFVKLSNE